jgi:hypothetical protein
MRELPADPWQWPKLTSEEIARLSADPANEAPEGPLFQYMAVLECNELRKEIESSAATSGFAVLLAVRHCATHGLVLPDWLAYAFNRRFDSVLQCRASSWDDPISFGSPYPKGSHKNAMRKARIGRIAVHLAVGRRLEAAPETAIDKALFESVGKELGYGSTLTSDYYYEAINKLGLHSHATAKTENFTGMKKKRP